jgi:aarF domain-containing kinase
MDNWLRLLLAAARQDRDECLRWSLKLGYLTGEEDDVSLSFSLRLYPRSVLIDREIRS